MDTREERVVVVGGGPAGLATAASLKANGIDALVLDQAESIGASWEAHYDRLHLHTVRWLSHLPGLRIPRSEGKWVPRDGVIRYLRDYAGYHDLDVHLSTRVTQIARNDGMWKLSTSAGDVVADSLVIATGYNREPVSPRWPGMESFAGEFMHSSLYRNGGPYRSKDVLIIGTGNSGAEIAVDLVEREAKTVWLSVRTAPNILRRDLAGFPTQMVGIVLRKLPGPVVDKVSTATQRLTVGDLTRYGMPSPEKGVYTRVTNEERIPLLDVGLIKALKKREVTVVATVERFEGTDVVLTDGRRLQPHAVIAATGFRRGLEDLVGHLGVLDEKGTPIVHGSVTHPAAPNLYFIGYSNPISGNLRELGIDAKRIAAAISTTVSSGTLR